MFDLDPLVLFYSLAALAAVFVAEAVYLLFHNTASYRTRVNRRLEVASKEADREKVLVQLRRERGLSADGDNLLPMVALNRLIVQSGITLKPARLVPVILCVAVATFVAISFFRGDTIEALAGAIVATVSFPFLALVFLRKRRKQKFAEQFPEAIDIIVRSLRAGPVRLAHVRDLE